MTTTVSFKTVGCRLNQAETACIRAGFEAAGYRVVPFGTPCAVCVVHGCTVTRRAERDSLRWVRLAKRLPGPPFVILAGCVVQAAAPDSPARGGADLCAGQDGKFALPAMLAERGFPAPPPESRAPIPRFETARAILKVQDGCEFRCAYCVVPRARGACVSRPMEQVAEEARHLAERGHRELVLTGANLGCYEHDGRRLVDVVAAVEAIPGVLRVRLSSIELSTVERPVVDHMTTSDKLCRFLHLPLQSGADPILKAMNRRYTAAQYRQFVAYAVDRIPLLGLGTDVIAGFPGEDEQAFRDTLRMIEELPFGNVHVFPYSPRPGTYAAALPAQVPERERHARAAALTLLADAKKAAWAARFVGKAVRVLIESVEPDGTASGWTDEYVMARIRGGNPRRNDLVTCTPTEARGASLMASLDTPGAAC